MSREGRERVITRPFAMGAFVFTVTTSSTEDRDVVESLFRDMPEPGSRETPIMSYTLIRGGSGVRAWTVAGPHLDEVTLSTLEAVLSLLVGAVNRSALDAEPHDLHLHAALATKDGRAVVIAAEPHTGKTTTVAHLAARDWSFVTDENVRLSPGAAEVTGLPKPLSFKPGGFGLVEHLEPWMIPPIDDGPDDFRFVPISASGATVVEGGTPHVVVLLRRPPFATPGSGPNAHRLHPVDAVVALMSHTFDAERFGPTAARLAELAAVSHCYELTVGTPTETVELIDELAGLDPVEPMDVTVLPASPAFSPGVVSLMLDDRVVVHDTVSGRIFALDAGGARVWRQLGGHAAGDASIDIEGPVIGPFVAQLRELGVVVGGA
jgi:hypothetical protein